MKVKFFLKDGELTSNISRQTYDIILACWHNGEKFRIGNGKIDGKDIRGIEVLEEDD